MYMMDKVMLGHALLILLYILYTAGLTNNIKKIEVNSHIEGNLIEMLLLAGLSLSLLGYRDLWSAAIAWNRNQHI